MRWQGLAAWRLVCGLMGALCACVSARSQPAGPASNDALAAEAVYDRLYNAIGTYRTKPRLVVRPPLRPGEVSAQRIAWFEPAHSRVVVDSEVLNLIRAEFGDDQFEQASSFVLGHELAHFMWQHGWAEHFGSRYPGLEVGRQAYLVADAQALRFNEAQADTTGVLLSYLAGYNVTPIVPQLISALYRQYKITNLDRYPSENERAEIARRSLEQAHHLVDVFDAGVLLLLVQQPEASAVCFDRIARDLPAREVLNNAGVAYAMAAAAQDEENRKNRPKLPFPIEDRYHMEELYAAFNIVRNIDPLLRAAQERLTRALQMDESYIPAHLSLACVYYLMQKDHFCLAHANEALSLAQDSGATLRAADARIMLGILFARQGNQPAADAEFQAAHAVRPDAAEYNARTLLEHSSLSSSTRDARVLRAATESLGGINPRSPIKQLEHADPVTFNPQPDAKYAGEIRTATVATPNGPVRAASVTIDRVQASFVSTQPGFTAASRQGIRLGSPRTDVIRVHGQPFHTCGARASTYLLYPASSIVFQIGPDDAVIGWTVYHVKQ